MNANKAIVYGVDTQIGLAMVRELGMYDVEVIAVGKSAHSIGICSKYASKHYISPRGEDAKIIEFLQKVHQETGAVYLLCVSEDDILFFNRNKGALSPIVPLVPELDTMNKVLSKEYTAALAEQLDIRVPKSFQLNSADELDGIIDGIHFPVILKWSNPHQVMKQLWSKGLKLEKIIYCYSKSELQQWVNYYEPIKAYPMIQEYCPGRGLGQFFFMHDGEPLLKFQHQRIHEWPPEGGVSSLCKGVSLDKHQALQDKSIALLRALNWQGVAMVEYRYDEQTDSAVLMEINGRFWGSFPLAFHSQVPFAWYTYKVLGLKEAPSTAVTSYPELYCRNTLVEFKRLIRLTFQRKLIKDQSFKSNLLMEYVEFVLGFLHPKMRYYVFSRKDIKPLVADIKTLVRKALKIN